MRGVMSQEKFGTPSITSSPSPVQDGQSRLFEVSGIVEEYAALKSVSALPLPSDHELEDDVMVTGTFTGNVKGHKVLRVGPEAGRNAITYFIEVVELEVKPA
jgi:hypothetical protein